MKIMIMGNKNKKVPDVAFLGVCERAKTIPRGIPVSTHLNILDLRNNVTSYIYPLSLGKFNFVFAIYDPIKIEPTKIIFESSKNEKLMDISLIIEKNYPNNIVEKKLENNLNYIFPVWTIIINKISGEIPVVMKPEIYNVFLCRDNYKIPIGTLNFDFIEAPLLTNEKIAAIKSSYNSAKYVRAVIECKKCKDNICIYAGLERSEKNENEGFVWYKDIKDSFLCKCKQKEIDLNYIKKNLHVLLGRPLIGEEEITSFTPLYEKNALLSICNNFGKLLKSNPVEEKIQKFIEKNPILLQQFSPQKIFYKKQILNKFITDIVVLNQKNELLLIELEKADHYCPIKNRINSTG